MSGDRITAMAGLEGSDAIAHRSDVLAMTEAASAAVLRPKEVGAFSHEQRAALAARIARLNGNDALAEHYGQGMSDKEVRLADPSFDGGADERWRAILAFTDRVSASPKDVTADDIESLSKAGLAEPDIVRLTQLNAFLAYEIRLIEGLRLMGAGA
ncbi:MAG: CMD domain-containing protein [Geminicoccaceae bacterium]